MVALAGSLRLAGIEDPISIDFATASKEVPAHVVSHVELPEELASWFRRAAAHSANGANAFDYAIEHAAPTMFGDLQDKYINTIQISIGSYPEAFFWSIRNKVADAALRTDYPIAHRLGLVMVGLKRPWYSPVRAEPSFHELLNSPLEQLLERLSRAALPPCEGVKQQEGAIGTTMPERDTALRRESRATQRAFQKTPHELLVALAAGTLTGEAAWRYIGKHAFSVGPNLQAARAKNLA